jgi:UDP-N-acetylglucosamine 2-epimerase
LKFCIIVGTRPQIIKSQPIINELISRNTDFTIIHTGQHYDYELSRTFFQELKIGKPDYNLGINSGSDSSQLAQIITKLEKLLLKISPDVVIVPGDTRSALGGALSVNRLGLKLAHVEAGARSNDFELEEEINRRLIDNCSNFLFAPTLRCAQNLKNEGVLGSIFNVGDTMYDVFLNYKKILKLEQFSKENLILMTIHRRQNILDITKMKKIIDIANFISKQGYNVIFPIHPHTKKQIKNFGISTENIQMTEPVNYSKMLILLSKAKLLLTDSGGLQKEAYWANTPCFTFRKSTEWIETLKEKNNFLIPEINNNTKKKILHILESQNSRNKPLKNYFGDGKASKKIISILLK